MGLRVHTSKKDRQYLAVSVGSLWLSAALLLVLYGHLMRLVQTTEGGPGALGLSALWPLGAILLFSAAFAVCLTGYYVWRNFNNMLACMDRSLAATLCIYVPIALLFHHALLSPGIPVVGDSGTHVVRAAYLVEALSKGEAGFWDNAFFTGGTLLQFTGPVFHWLVALVDLVLGNIVLSTKVVLVVARLGAGAFMLWFLRLLGWRGLIPLVGGLLAVGAFTLTYLLSVRGSFPQVMVAFCFTGLLALSEYQLQRQRAQMAAVLALALLGTLFIGSHQPTAVYGACLLAIYIIVRLWGAPNVRGPLQAFVGAGLLVVPGVVYFVLPFMLEGKWTAAPELLDGTFRLAIPDPELLSAYLTWGKYGLGPLYGAYLGYGLLGLALLVPLFRWQWMSSPVRRIWLALALMAGLCLFLRGSYVRESLLLALVLVPMAMLGLGALMAKQQHRLGGFLMVFLLLEAAGLSVQPWLRLDQGYLLERSAWLNGNLRDSRIVEIRGGEATGGPNTSPLQYQRVQSLHGPHKMDAAPAHNAVMTALSLTQEAINTHGYALDREALDALGLFNAGMLVSPAREGLGAGPGLEQNAILGGYRVIADHSPVLWAPRLVPLPPAAWNRGNDIWLVADVDLSAHKADMRELLALMRPDYKGRTAAAIAVQEGIAGQVTELAQAEPGVVADVQLESYEVGQSSVSLNLRVSAKGFVRIAHPYSRFGDVSLNGAHIAAVPDITGMIVVPVGPGLSSITIVWRPTLLRTVCFWISMATIFGMLAVLLGMGIGAVWRRRAATDAKGRA